MYYKQCQDMKKLFHIMINRLKQVRQQKKLITIKETHQEFQNNMKKQLIVIKFIGYNPSCELAYYYIATSPIDFTTKEEQFFQGFSFRIYILLQKTFHQKGAIFFKKYFRFLINLNFFHIIFSQESSVNIQEQLILQISILITLVPKNLTIIDQNKLFTLQKFQISLIQYLNQLFLQIQILN
ncbi:unnamed protein product [Paramecium sonneborni]|uniref:Uncharacterized protein n=1 Tax=Paramecium sonneborni TaxID=65129 RepID=A0A8S1QB66_9CILI|nr:unnamed protein product [Paramecium sonneborni]